MTSSKSNPAFRNVPPPAGGGTPKSSVYTRFIPREELDSFAAWNPDALSGQGEAPRAGVHKAQPEPPPPPPEDPGIALNAARQAGYQDGYRDGMAALDAFKQSFAAQISAQMGQVTQAYTSQMDDLQQDMARALAVSATHLARQIVRSELQARPELVAVVAQQALETLLLSARHVTVRVHPDDHALVALGAEEVLQARGARLLSDASVTRGGCLVESDIGVIDASMETRWRRAAASLGCEGEWPADAPAASAGGTDAEAAA